jgi:hypothetical protein
VAVRRAPGKAVVHPEVAALAKAAAAAVLASRLDPPAESEAEAEKVAAAAGVATAAAGMATVAPEEEEARVASVPLGSTRAGP